MPTSLYQKYRPQQFADLVGQDHIRTTLVNELKSGSVTHAYLFSGPRGIGKTTSARLLARAVNCLDRRDGEPCNACTHCNTILAGKALDLMEMDAASHTGVDNVRENIIDNARVAPSFLPWKVFIIDEVHMLSTSAFNALLKTLEEPPPQTMFVLATTEIHKVPATIVSRCEHFAFRKVARTAVVARLEELCRQEQHTVDREVLVAIAKRSEGALRDAESLLGQIFSLSTEHISAAAAAIVLPAAQTEEVIGLWEEIVKKQTREALTRISRLYDDGVLLTEFTKEFIEFLRILLLYKIQNSLTALEYVDIDEKLFERIRTLISSMEPQHIVEQLEEFLDAFEQLKNTSIPQLPLELAVVALTHPASTSAVLPENPRHDVADSGGIGEPIAASPAPTARPSVPTSVPVTNRAEDITLDTIHHAWESVLSAMKRENHGLHLTLKVGRILGYDSIARTLTIGFQYKFYQDRLRDARNQPIIDGVLKSVFGTTILLATDVNESYGPADSGVVKNLTEPSPDEVENVWELAQAAFGTTPDQPRQ